MGKLTPVIVIIEDDPHIRRFLRRGLEAHGFEIHEAETGQLGFKTAETHKPDLIILDLGLPDIDGINVIRKLRKWTSRPIVIISARNLESDKVEALDSGGDGYISKHFGVLAMIARVKHGIVHTTQP